MNEWVKVIRDQEVAIALLNRPQAFNAFDLDLMEHFCGSSMTLSVKDSARAVVISGEGNAFCAGGDLGKACVVHYALFRKSPLPLG